MHAHRGTAVPMCIIGASCSLQINKSLAVGENVKCKMSIVIIIIMTMIIFSILSYRNRQFGTEIRFRFRMINSMIDLFYGRIHSINPAISSNDDKIHQKKIQLRTDFSFCLLFQFTMKRNISIQNRYIY